MSSVLKKHAATRVAERLLEQTKRRMRDAQKTALDTFQPGTLVTMYSLIAEHEGRIISGGRANFERFNAALRYLETDCGFELGFMQIQLMEIARLILIPRMFGSQIERERHYLRIRLGLKRLHQQAAITLPRRAGKTVAQTLLAALVAVTQPDGNVACFQLGSRQAKDWLSQVIQVMGYFKGSEWDWTEVERTSKEFIRIYNCCKTTTTVASYPGPRDAGATNYRGVGQKLMLLLYDEFYFFKEVVYTVSLPLAKNGASILMISSMAKDHDNAIRRMIYTKMEDGKDFFLQLNWLRACPDCVTRGVANDCDHIEHRPQHFEPRGAMKRMRFLMTPFGKDNFDRELMNTAGRSTRVPVFHPDLLAPLRNPETGTFRLPVTGIEYDEFFIGVDPAGGGFSCLAIVSMVFDKINRPLGLDHRLLILGAEVIPGKTLTTMDLGEDIVNHALHIRQTIPQLRNAMAVICIENNSMLVAPSVTRAIMQNPRALKMGIMQENVKAMRAGTGGFNAIDVRTGTRTTKRSKESVILKMNDLLLNGAFAFHPQFCVPQPLKQPPGRETAEVARQLLIDELANYCQEYCHSKGPIASQQKGHVKYHGFSADGTPVNDDKFMCLSFCLICQPLYAMGSHLFVKTVAAR